MYIPVYHTNGRPIKNTIGVVMNLLVGMGLYRVKGSSITRKTGHVISERLPKPCDAFNLIRLKYTAYHLLTEIMAEGPADASEATNFRCVIVRRLWV